MIKFVTGVDLGQSQDYTAISILECMKEGKEAKYYLRHLERVRGEPYFSIVKKDVKMIHYSALKGSASLVFDATGIGAHLIDFFGRSLVESCWCVHPR